MNLHQGDPPALSGFESFVVLLSTALVLRLISFFPPVIDHDESTYIVIADALLQGDVYLHDVIDTKPIGIFLLFAGFLSVFGKSILTIRIMTTLWMVMTAWLIMQVHRRLITINGSVPSGHGPLASGLIYIVMTSVFTFFGVSPNTEIFTAGFAILALYVLLKNDHIAGALVTGILLGLGFLIKYIVAFDALAIGLFFIWWSVRKDKPILWWMSRGILMVAGFAIPFALTWQYYAGLGMEETFRFFTFELSGRYFIETTWWSNVVFILDFLLRFFPVTLWFFYCSKNRTVTGPALPVLSWIWAVCAVVVIILPGKLFYHYFIQLMVPFSLLAGSFFDARRTLPKALAWMRRGKIVYPLLVIALAAHLFFQKKDLIDKKDYVRDVAAWLNERLEPGDKIYTGNYHQILYLLTGTTSPTPYVHSSLIWDAKNNHALMIEQETEWKKILEQQPRFILYKQKNKSTAIPLLPLITEQYQQAATFGGNIFIMEHR